MSTQIHSFYDDDGPVAHDDLDPAIVAAYHYPELSALDSEDYPTAAAVAGQDGDISVTSAKDYDIKYRLDCGVETLHPAVRYQDGIIGPNDERISVVQEPAGIYVLTVRTRDGDGDPIADVQVDVVDATGQAVRRIATGPTGENSCNLNAGAYTLRPVKAWVDIDDVEIDLDESMTVTIIGVVRTPTASTGEVQTIWYRPRDPALILDEASTLYAEAAIGNQFIGDDAFTGTKKHATKVGDRYEIPLAKGGRFRLIGQTGGAEWLKGVITVSLENDKGLSEYGL